MFKKFIVLTLTVFVLFIAPFSAFADCQSECSAAADEGAPQITNAYCSYWCGIFYPGWSDCYTNCYNSNYGSFWWTLYDNCMDECQ